MRIMALELDPQAPGPDESRVLDLLRARLALGAQAYGPLEIADDQRDWTQEAVEEVLDAAIYLAIALVRIQRRGAKP
jgi:hypothetical protein